MGDSRRHGADLGSSSTAAAARKGGRLNQEAAPVAFSKDSDVMIVSLGHRDHSRGRAAGLGCSLTLDGFVEALGPC